MTNMAAMPIYGKNLEKASSPEPRDPWPWNLVCSVMYGSTTKIVQIMTLGVPWPILRQGQIWLHRLLYGKSENYLFFGTYCSFRSQSCLKHLAKWVYEVEWVKVILWSWSKITQISKLNVWLLACILRWAIQGLRALLLFELIPLKCIYLHSDKKIPKCASTDRGCWNKNSEQSANNQDRTEIFACQTILSCFLWKKSYFFFICFFFCAVIFFASAFAQCIYGTAGQTQCAKISVHTLERLLMRWLLVITFDMLLIKFMQTAQLTFNGRTITEFFAVLFLFRCGEKVRDPPNSPRSVICWDLFLYFGGTLWCYKWATQ